jgi:hypothetical protein
LTFRSQSSVNLVKPASKAACPETSGVKPKNQRAAALTALAQNGWTSLNKANKRWKSLQNVNFSLSYKGCLRLAGAN